jgi:hypothetical protein
MSDQATLARLWEEHIRHEFVTKSTDDTIATIWLQARLDTAPQFCGLEVVNAAPDRRQRGIRPRQLSGDCRADLGHYHQNRPHRAL